MSKKQVAVNPAETISAMRADALLAYLEWPVFLHIRLSELNEALAITGEGQSAPVPTNGNDHSRVQAPQRDAPPDRNSMAAVDPAASSQGTPETHFVPDLAPASEPDAVIDFLAQFPNTADES